MNPVQITSIVIVVLYALILLAYIFSVSFLSKDVIILGISILFIISIFMNFMPGNKSAEKFYFEVSPQRKKCLKEQVSLDNYGEKRSCSCCQKGTVGGYPPNYESWFQPNIDNESLWQRTDNWTTDKKEETMIPPTEYVPVPPRKLKRSQMEMYTQSNLEE